jgi:hypothetical protein
MYLPPVSLHNKNSTYVRVNYIFCNFIHNLHYMNKICLFTLNYKSSRTKLFYEVQREELTVTSRVLHCHKMIVNM